MRGRSDATLDAALLLVAGKRPSDILTLLAAARAALGPALAKQEFVVHVALHRLVRTGWVVVTGAARSGLALYANPAAAGGATEPAFSPHVAGDDPVARNVSRVVKDPAARARIAVDVAAHLAALAAEGKTAAFGSPRAARALLKRVDGKQRTVVLTAGMGDSVLRFFVHEGPWILGAIALFLGVKFLAADVFVIPSDSMVPTLIEGDRVVVTRRWGSWTPERWQVVTFQHPGVDGPKTTWVKRAVGMPGEEIAIWHGDVYAGRTLLVKPDDLAAELRSHVKAWTADASGLPGWTSKSVEAGMETWAPPRGALVAPSPGDVAPIDLYLELDVDLPEGGSAVLHFHRFADQDPASQPENSWHLEAGRIGARLTETHREVKPVAPTLLFEHAAPLRGRVTLALAVVDGVVRASVGEHAWHGVRDMPTDRTGFAFTTVGKDVRPAQFRVDQDLHYSNRGSIAVPAGNASSGPGDHRHLVPKDAILFLGDNTQSSHDSRFPEVGDIALEKLTGPVVFRIWPPSRIGKVR